MWLTLKRWQFTPREAEDFDNGLDEFKQQREALLDTLSSSSLQESLTQGLLFASKKSLGTYDHKEFVRVLESLV